MTLKLAALLVISYLLGAVPVSYLIAKWVRGIDLRNYGSGNVGVTNLISATTWYWGLPAIFYDIAKGAAPVYVAHLLGLGMGEQVGVGLAAIIGHNWSVFLRFNAGRGLLTTLPVITIWPLLNGYFPAEIALFFVVMAIGLFAFHNIPTAAAISTLLFPLLSLFLGRPLPITLGLAGVLFITTIRRLTVPISPQGATLPKKELLLNRLLYDRDIKDRKAWLERNQEQHGSS